MIRHVARKLQTCKLQKVLASHNPNQPVKSKFSFRQICDSHQTYVFCSSSLKSRRYREEALKICRCFHLEKAFSTCANRATEPRATEQSCIIEVPLAQTGEGIADCELLKWLVNEGDEIEEFQPLCSIQSDKATIQITSRYKGKVSRLNFVPGDVVKVGESLLELLSGRGVHPSSENEVSGCDVSGTSDSDSLVDTSNVRPLATPAIRQLARSHGINLEYIPGSGKDGRVLKEDLLKVIDAKKGLNEEMATISNIAPKEEHVIAPPSDKTEYSGEGSLEGGQEGAGKSVHLQRIEDTFIHVRGYQRTMVKTMTAAAAIPHFYLVDEVKLDVLMNYRNGLQESCAGQDVKLTYLPFMMKALSVALLKYPLMNSTLDEETSTIWCKGSHNVGVAVATPRGLAVPNIKNVQHLSITEIAVELERLKRLATDNKLREEDISGGTISVSNFGSIGGKVGYPVLNLPEVAIGAFGRKHKVPCFADDGSIYPVSVMNVTWAADHRVLDGATLAKFFNEWKLLIEQPERLLIRLK